MLFGPLSSKAHLVGGTPVSALSSHCILAALSPDEDAYHHEPNTALFESLSVLQSVAQKVQESTASDRPAVARPAREAKELLKSIDALTFAVKPFLLWLVARTRERNMSDGVNASRVNWRYVAALLHSSMSTPATPPPNVKPAWLQYRQALQAISTRTGAPLSSLVVSFGILHELTAIVPVAGFFFGARALGVGERVVNAVQSDASAWPGGKEGWVRQTCGEWVDEGKIWAEKVGHRYGVFGYEKRRPGDNSTTPRDTMNHASGDFSSKLAGDAANAIVAYGLTKALLPVRIGFSLYFSPAFSRRIVDPIRGGIVLFVLLLNNGIEVRSRCGSSSILWRTVMRRRFHCGGRIESNAAGTLTRSALQRPPSGISGYPDIRQATGQEWTWYLLTLVSMSDPLGRAINARMGAQNDENQFSVDRSTAMRTANNYPRSSAAPKVHGAIHNLAKTCCPRVHYQSRTVISVSSYLQREFTQLLETGQLGEGWVI
ncbi:hypothetical protein NM688_g2669 [Phlebia brevispora]|uniref:Uncharacterized protein n=1 Tax=Phlebia brevispora TaxID=194682 RepID=A0ACC1T866_9APHY|nr:hypothetical protein NM688_g2669 [Phlebia brevispora]